MGWPVSRSRLVLQTNLVSRLGAVSLSGYIRHNRGISLVDRRTLKNYALVYLLDGSGRIRLGGHPVVKCRAGDMFFLHPGVPHGYGPGPGEVWSEFYIVFHGPVFDLWRRQGFLSPDRPLLRLAHIRRWLPQLETIVESRLPNTPEGMLWRVCRLQKFLSEIVEPEEQDRVPVPWLEPAERRLMETPEVPLPEIARGFGLSYETFRKEFARHTGRAPGHYRTARLIEQARVLMTERGLSNKEIAETLGFYDEFHFSRRFRQVTGKTTQQFRRGAKAAE